MVKNISTEDFVREQAHDEFFSCVLTRLEEVTNVPFILHNESVLTPTVERFDQVAIYNTLRIRRLHVSHHFKLTGHSWGRKLN